MGTLVRSFRKNDGKAFVGLVEALARYERLQPPTVAARRRLIRDIGKRVQVLLAEVDGKAVGYAIYFFSYSSFLGRPTLYLEDLFLLSEARGTGLGQRLWKELERRARAEGCRRMEFIVLDWNKPALRFYEKLGARRLKGWGFYRKPLAS